MKARLPVLFCILFMVFGCSKSDNNSKPTIKLVTYTSEVHPNDVFNAKFSLSINSGNITGDSLIVLYHRYNATPIPDGEDRGDTYLTFLPETPNATKSEFTAQLAWADISYGINDENDTVDFKFILIDLAGNRSDTVKTGKVIVFQN